MKLIASLLLFSSFVGLVAAQPAETDVTPVEYSDPYDGDFPLLGYVSLPEVTPAPAVVIIPEWDNVDEYEQLRATMIAQELGYVGFAADIYGPDLQGVEDIATRREQATLYRSNSTLFYGRMQAAIDLMKAHPDVDADNVAIIGYCFGGTGVLTYSFLGGDSVSAAISFHGGLTEFPVMESINHPVLVLSGGDDDTGTAVEDLENQLNEANATWQITRFSGIEHAFTVWTDDRYSERADSRSWAEMGTFLGEAFEIIQPGTTPPEATDVTPVEYDDDGFPLTGFLSIPPGAEMDQKYPAVVIVPGWAGVGGADGYEAHRATMLAEEGYIAIAADIYGSDLTVVDEFDVRVEQATLYRTDYALFVSRIQAAVNVLKEHEMVDPNNILMIGYCFGGTGVVDYAFAGLTDVKAVVPFHGGLTSLAPIETDAIYPYMLVQSGGEDDAHGNNTELEMALNDANAIWEITRYSNVFHGFTDWDSQAYNARADSRSWDAMLEVFDRVMAPTIVELALATDDLSTLVDLVIAAGLVDALSGEGPFTVFAPTNDAFSMVPEELLAELGEDTDALIEVLLYHVVEGAVLSTDLEDGMMVTTLNGAQVQITLPPAMVNDVTILLPDVIARNGVVHVVDAVLLPPAAAVEDLPEMGPQEESEDEVAVSKQNPDMEP